LSTKISEQEIIVMDDAINNGNEDGRIGTTKTVKEEQ
jgi:hypothetical protein